MIVILSVIILLFGYVNHTVSIITIIIIVVQVIIVAYVVVNISTFVGQYNVFVIIMLLANKYILFIRFCTAHLLR